MSQENVEIVKETIAAFNGGDLDAALSRFARDSEFQELISELHGRHPSTGTDRIRKVWGLWLDLFDELHVDVEDTFDAADAVICKSRWTGHGRIGGQPLDARQFDVYELRNGKIVRVRLGYKTKAEAFKAVGLSD